ncbi:adenylosuccinate lyase [Oceanobacillus neutriphilus]|uniref:Adenylosuccinate lyase n=1 Tax=Oceanobacillus neutriphilus TaxID=531815 RepID=A0ABQ2NQE8_9BACI|nr:adenylosuccinate lyase [Oceanobacillus neutriphilus]GGP07871.1 3-carboxy-cis,cis-muconate cycloisomerase [Oceanobacillus neutriphilus]
MSAAIYDSVLFKDLFGTEEMREIFSDSYLVQKWLDVEAALARAEAHLNIIPDEAAKEIDAKAKVENMDLNNLGVEIKRTSHPIVPLIRQLSDVCEDGYGQYVHWGATTQDIMDSANVLQLKEVVKIIEREIKNLQLGLIHLIEENKEVVLAGRTHGQQALPITFGYKAAVWLSEINRSSERLAELKPRLLVGQFSGAVGTLASVTSKGLELQKEIMKELGVGKPDISWHAARDTFAEFASFLGVLSGTLGKIANEVVQLQKTEFGELEEPFQKGKVGSSTMPHKRNPSKTENIVTLARILKSNVPLFIECLISEHERDMISWQVEWETLPEVCLLISNILRSSNDVIKGLQVNKDRMEKNLLELTNGLIVSESIMIKIGEKIGRQKAHDIVYDACMEAYENNIALEKLLLENSEIMDNLSKEELDELFNISNYTGYSNDYADTVVQKTKEKLNG